MAKLELQIGDKTYDKAWVDDLSSTSQISTDPAGINYGVIPSTGSAKLRDLGGAIRADIEAGVLPASNAQTKIRINDNQIQEHTTSDSDYDVINRELNLDFSDRLSLLDKVTYGGMPLRDYSMSAYEMLDDVIGSYGGYVKEVPINWVKYSHPAAITVPTANVIRIDVDTVGGYEIIGTPIRLKAGEKHTINCSIRVGKEYTALDGTNGIAVQILKSAPTDSDCKSIALVTKYLSTTVSTNILSLEFTPETDLVYFIINFGYASDSQNVMVDINSVGLDGHSIKNSLDNPHSRTTYVSGSTLAASSISLYTYLKGVTLDYPYLESASYRETIEKFCTLAQMTLSLDEDGKIVFRSAMPQIFSSAERTNTPIIDANHKISNFNKTLFLKNKVDGVDIKQSRVKDENETAVPVYTASYGEPVSVEQATGGSTSGLFTPTSELGCTFNATERGTSGTDKYAAYAGMSSSWGNYSVAIPKKSLANLSQVLDVWTTKDSSGNPYISYSTEYKIERQTFSFNTDANATQAPYNFEFTGYQSSRDYNEAFHKISHTASVSDNFSCTISITDRLYIAGMSVEETDDYYKLNVRLQQSTKWYDATSNYSQYLGYSLGNGTLYTATISGVTISVKGVKRTISFVEEDLSTPNIKSANNAVSIPTNELMQNESDVTEIRDNILMDYANGVQTGTQKLFCGVGDWEHGEIMQPYDTVRIEGEDGYWRVTGRTFKYAGAPTLSLELQKLHEKEWNDIDIGGGISTGTISTGTFTENGEKTGSIRLPSGYDYYSDNSAYIVSVVFNLNGEDSTETRASMGTASLSKYNGLGIHTVHCTITANWVNGILDYVAEEKYNKRAGYERRSYVKSITVTRLAQFY